MDVLLARMLFSLFSADYPNLALTVRRLYSLIVERYDLHTSAFVVNVIGPVGKKKAAYAARIQGYEVFKSMVSRRDWSYDSYNEK